MGENIMSITRIIADICYGSLLLTIIIIAFTLNKTLSNAIDPIIKVLSF